MDYVDLFCSIKQIVEYLDTHIFIHSLYLTVEIPGILNISKYTIKAAFYEIKSSYCLVVLYCQSFYGIPVAEAVSN